MATEAKVTATELDELKAQVHSLECRLAEAHRMAALGRLAAGIVHEVNTPVGSILANTETMRRMLDKVRVLLAGVAVPPKALELLASVDSLISVDQIACERISATVRGLKTFARGNEDELRRIKLDELISNMLKLTHCTRRRLSLVTEFAPLPEVECYPQLLAQALLNLLVNAAQATPDSGTVTVRTALEGGQVYIGVSDTGHGIPPEVRDRIFGAGFTTKPLGEGTGLGLNITREIVVDRHHGTIRFDTEVGQGTTFHIRIPLTQPERI